MLHQSNVQKQSQKFSPLQIQMLNLLHLTSHELEQKIKDELEENPALETGADDDIKDDNTDNQVDEDDDFKDDKEDYSDFYEQYEDDIPQYKMNDAYSQHDAENFFIPFVQHSSFYDKIKEQISLMDIDEKTRIIADFLIDSLDDDGYLRTELEELSYQYSFSHGVMVETEEMESVLKIIQQCDPAGIGARNLKECLLIQLDRIHKKTPEVTIAYKLLKDHASDMENRNYSRIMRVLNIDSEDLKDAIEVITKLNPKPNVVADEALNINHITPEFTVTAQDGNLTVSLTNKYLPEIKLNSKIIEMLNSTASQPKSTTRSSQDRSAISFMKNKINSAKWLIDALKQRERTMSNIISAIGRLQYEFFITGDFKNLKPMILKNVAEIAGVDISSVSRVTSNKYVQTDFGTFLLKELFSEGMAKQSGEVVSNKEIQNIIKDILETEDKDTPFTDFQIADVLTKKGYNVARRTVAKYRECLDIPVAKMRRCLV